MNSKTHILGERIKYLRKNAHLNQRELAELLKISHSTLSLYESGQRTPNDSVKIKIADFFNVSVDYLVGHKSEESVAFKNLSKSQVYLLKVSENLDEKDLEKVFEYAELLSIKKLQININHK